MPSFETYVILKLLDCTFFLLVSITQNGQTHTLLVLPFSLCQSGSQFFSLYEAEKLLLQVEQQRYVYPSIKQKKKKKTKKKRKTDQVNAPLPKSWGNKLDDLEKTPDNNLKNGITKTSLKCVFNIFFFIEGLNSPVNRTGSPQGFSLN